jgi:hypothetical protein
MGWIHQCFNVSSQWTVGIFISFIFFSFIFFSSSQWTKSMNNKYFLFLLFHINGSDQWTVYGKYQDRIRRFSSDGLQSIIFNFYNNFVSLTWPSFEAFNQSTKRNERYDYQNILVSVIESKINGWTISISTG